ncbi:MAG: bifunctional [glutamine synthetase] adenylyltransferase/[glutamine synthetase]-adenylyl-L-tyrosine phosphorylase [Armatimonadetes bacterium]|nr:bifunctional [glutamine synthetase] adenylyltransferase/[glutamine synthetase]-adenylyl-L-tyrosine phosphorylase [Armatimonadota bacterium]
MDRGDHDSLVREVAGCGVRDLAAARQMLASLLAAAPDAAAFARLADALRACLPECADPDLALANLHRWLAQLGFSLSVQRLLVEDAHLLRHLLLLFAASQYFADILCRDPHYYELLADLPALTRARSPEAIRTEVERAVAPFRTYDGRLEALRRVKRREILRIGARDVLGIASFTETVADLSAFAEAAVGVAYQVARAEMERRYGPCEGLEFAVIAMGKLGGRELNYSSDIDLMFVYRGGQQHVEAAQRIGERLIQALARPTAEGYVFRVDMRLRPEGKVGPLVRSLDAYRDYYDHHLEHWERQALLKARFIAGEAALGAEFMAMLPPRIFSADVPPGLVEALRLNKLRLEKRVELSGERYTNVKDGYGGIRDVEFTVQLLQLLFGARCPALQTGNTLEALAALETAGLIAPEEQRAIGEAYQFLRTVEHRLQILDERAVRCLPRDPLAVERLARRLPRHWQHDPAAEFIAEHRRRAGVVRAFHRRLFYGEWHGSTAGPEDAGAEETPAVLPRSPLGETLLALDTEEARQHVRQYLAAQGFSASDRALADVERLAGLGGHEPARLERLALLARVGPPLLAVAAAAPDPDAALSFVAELAQGGDPEGFLTALGESPFAREVLCRLGGTAPTMAAAVRREPALLDMLLEPEAVVTPADAAALRARLEARWAGLSEHEARLNALRRFKRREMLRIAAADVLAAHEGDRLAQQLTLLAETCVRAALELAIAEAQARGDLVGEPQFAVIGLGKVGGRELLYSSDLDLVLVCDLPEGDAREQYDRAYQRLAELFQEAMTRLLPDGDLYPIDLRLRPEGKGGDLIPSLDACRRYYAGRAQTWERQAMLKARLLAGDARVGEAFLAIIGPFAYPTDPSPALADEVRAMKQRVENERADPATRGCDLKLGPGGLSDVEWLVQRYQLCYGHARPALRETNTLAALAALEGEGLLPPAEAAVLREGYCFQTRLRNLMTLRSGRQSALLPEGDEDQRALARAMDLDNAGELLEAFSHHRQAIRQVFLARF